MTLFYIVFIFLTWLLFVIDCWVPTLYCTITPSTQRYLWCVICDELCLLCSIFVSLSTRPFKKLVRSLGELAEFRLLWQIKGITGHMDWTRKHQWVSWDTRQYLHYLFPGWRYYNVIYVSVSSLVLKYFLTRKPGNGSFVARKYQTEVTNRSNLNWGPVRDGKRLNKYLSFRVLEEWIWLLPLKGEMKPKEIAR